MVKAGSKAQTFGTPCLKIKLKNALNQNCTTIKTTCSQNISSVWRSLLEVFPPDPPKCALLGPEPKKCSCFFWVKLRTANTRKLKLISYYRLCENLWWPLEAGPGHNLDPICHTPHPPKKENSFLLILQE